MGLFSKKRGKEFLDLSKYNKKQPQTTTSEATIETKPQEPANPFSFFGNASYTQPQSEPEESDDQEEKKKKFAKRMLEMTSKIESLSNQIYHLQQRIEVIEKKLDLNRF